MEKFTNIEKGNVLIEVVNLDKATGENADEFKSILLKSIELDKINIIVDIHQCEFLDSTFISSLLIALKAAIKKGGKLKIASPKQDVAKMLEATGMNRVFDIYLNIPDAVKSFSHN